LPQVASLLVVGWVFAGVSLKPNPPWAKNPPPPSADSSQPRPDPRLDEAICRGGYGHSLDARLNACGRLIGEGADWPYFTRAKIYFRNGDYDRAIEDFSAFIHKYPYSEKLFNERGLSYAKKGEYDRAIADYTEAIRLNREAVGRTSAAAPPTRKKANWTRRWPIFGRLSATAAPQLLKTSSV
jgi:tetratricopeptide (TPR) repeat protein